MKKLALALALSSAFVSMNAQAWGNEGHRVVGAIAEKLIKGSNAEKQVAALLLPGESLQSITNWADTAKGGAGYAIPTDEMKAYTAANPKHSEYHYTDIPFQKDKYVDGGVGGSEVDIVQTLKQAIAVLQGKTDPALNPHNFTKRQALLIIAHMAGDIHQPLHVGAAFVGKDGKFKVPERHEDIDNLNVYDSRGGNNLLIDDDKLTSYAAAIPGEAKALPPGAQKWTTRPFHAYWDSTVVDYAMRRITTKTPDQFADKVIAQNPAVSANTGDPATWPYQWANDSLIAAKIAYTDVTPGAIKPMVNKKGETYYTFNLEMAPNYPVPSSDLAKKQLIKGGYNLAALLKAIWP